MDKKYTSNFKRPSSSLGKRTTQRVSLSGVNDSRLETISETLPTPSSSRRSITTPADESFTLGYNSLCDETLKTPLSCKYSSSDHFRTPKFTSNLRLPSVGDSHKKKIRTSLCRPEANVKTVSLQTGKDIDDLGTPPIVLRKRLNLTTSVYHDLEEEYQQLKEFTTLEKQVLSVEGLSELQLENVNLKSQVRHLSHELNQLTEKFHSFSEETGLIELKAENVMIKSRLDQLKAEQHRAEIITDADDVAKLRVENASLKEKLELMVNEKIAYDSALKENCDLKAKIDELKDSFDNQLKIMSTENECLIKKFNTANNKLIDLEMTSESKMAKWYQREEELSRSLQDAWDLLNEKGIKEIKKKELNLIELHHISEEGQEAKGIMTLEMITNDKVSQLNEDLKEKERELKESQNQIDLLKDELKEMEGELKGLKKIVEELKDVKEKEGEMYKEKISQLEGSYTKIKSLNEELKEKETSLEESNNKIILLNEELKANFKESEELKEKISQLEESYIKIESLNEELKEKKTTLEEESNNKIILLNEELKEKETSLEESNNKIILLNEKLEMNIKDSRELKEKISQLEESYTKVVSLIEELKEKETALEESNNKIILLNEELRTLEDKLKEKEMQLEKSFGKIGLLNDQQKVNEIRLEESKENGRALEETNNKITLVNDDLKMNITDLKEKISDLEGSNSKIGSLNEELKEKERALEELYSQIGLFNKELKEKEYILKEAEMKSEESSNKIAKLNEELEVNIRELEGIKELFKEKESESKESFYKIGLLNEELKEMDRQLKEKSKELDYVKEKEVEVLKDKERESEELEEKRKEIFIEKTKQLEELYSKIEQLNKEVEEKARELNEYHKTIDLMVIDFKDRSMTLMKPELIEINSRILKKDNELDKMCIDVDEHTGEFDVNLEKSNSSINTLSNKLSVLNIIYSHISDKLKEKNSNLEELYHVLNNKETELENISDEIHQRDSTCKELLNSLHEKESVITNLKEIVEKKNIEIEQLSHLLSEENLSITSIKEKYDVELSAMINEKCYLDKKHNDICSELDYYKRLCTEKDLKVNYIKKELSLSYEVLENVFSDLKSTKESLDKEMREQSNVIRDLNCRLHISNNELTQLNDDISNKMEVLYSFALTVCESTVIGKTFDDIIHLLETKFNELNNLSEHYRNVIMSKEEVMSKKAKNYEISYKELLSDKMEVQQKLNKLEMSYADLLSKSLEEANNAAVEKDSNIENLALMINDLKIQIDAKSFAINSKDDKLTELNERIFGFEREKNEYFKELLSLGCMNGSECLNLNNFNDSVNYIKNKFQQCNDLIEHLRNLISSKDEKICRLNKEIYTASASELEKINAIHQLQEYITFQKDQIDNNDKLVKESLVVIMSQFDSNITSSQTLEEIIDIFKRKFLEFDEFKEHLKNIIESKNNKIICISQNLSQKQLCLSDLESQMSLILDELFCCRSELNVFKENELTKCNEKNILENKILLLEDQSGALSAELHLFKETISSLINNVGSKSSEDLLKSLRNQISDFSEINEHLKNSIQSKDQKIDRLKKALKPVASNQVFKSQTCRIVELEGQLEKKNEELTMFKGELNKLLADFSLFNERINNKFVFLDNQFTSIIDNLEYFKGRFYQVQDLEHTIQKNKEEINNLNEQNRRDNIEINRLLDCEKNFHSLVSDFELLKNILKQELSEAISSLDRTGNIQEKEDKIQSIVKECNKFQNMNIKLSDELNSVNLEKKVFFTELQQLCSTCNLSDEEIVSFNQALSLINLRIAEFDQLKEHLKNQISSKEDQLSKVKTEVISLRKLNEHANIKADRRVEVCSVLFKELSELACLFYPETPIVDEYNYRDTLNIFKVKCVEFFDLLEHLRNIIHSRNDKISKLVRDAIAKQTAYKNVSSFVSKQNEELRSVNTAIDSYKINLDMKDNLINRLNADNSLFETEKETYVTLIKSLEEKVSSFKDLISTKEQTIVKMQEDLEEYQCRQVLFISKISDFLSSYQSGIPTIQGFDDVFNALVTAFSEFNEIIEHLRNTVKSKQDKLENVGELYKSLRDQSESYSNELSEALFQIDSYKVKEETTNIFIKSLQEDIINQSAEFTTNKEDLVKQITSLSELKEHLENKVQSKDEKIAKMTVDFSVYKQKCLMENDFIINRLKDEVFLKSEELEILITSKDELLNQISNLDDQISILKKDIEIKDKEFNATAEKLNSVSSNYDALIKERAKIESAYPIDKIQSLEDQLSNIFVELDTYKANEVMKDKTIHNLEQQILELNHSLSGKTKEILSCKENLDRLSENIVELIRDKESFFDSLHLLPIPINVKTFEEVNKIVKLNHCEMLDLKVKCDDIEKLKTQIEAISESEQNVKELNDELLMLKESYKTAMSDLTEYKNKEDLSSESISLISKICKNYLINEDNDSANSVSSIKEEIIKLDAHIEGLNSKIQFLENKFEEQTANNIKSNEEFINTLNNEFLSKLESTNIVMNNLCSEMSCFEDKISKEISLKDIEINDLHNEMRLTLSNLGELVEASESQSQDVESLITAYTTLLSENKSLVNNCYSSLQMSHDNDTILVNDIMKINEDLMSLVQEMNSNFHINHYLNYKEYNMDYTNESYSKFMDSSLDSITKSVKDIISEFNLYKEFDCSDQIIHLKNSLLNNPFDCLDSVPAQISIIDRDILSMKFTDILNSISQESKIIDSLCSSCINSMYEMQNSLSSKSNNFNDSINRAASVPNETLPHPEISLLMSVDHSVIETSHLLDSSTKSVDKSETSFVSPEKTVYILPGGHLNISNEQEKTFYYHSDIGSMPSMAIDPLKASDKTIASSCNSDWLNFNSRFHNNYINVSTHEIIDAQDPFNSLNISTRQEDPLKFHEPVDTLSLNQLKSTLNLSDISNKDFISQLSDAICAVESIKTNIKVEFPDILDNDVNHIFSELCKKVHISEEKLSVISEKNKSMASYLLTVQDSIKEVKSVQQSSSFEFKHFQKNVLNNVAQLEEAVNNWKNKSYTLETKVQNLDSLKSDHEKLSHLYDNSLEDLKVYKDLNNSLTISIENCNSKLEDSLANYDQLLNEKNKLFLDINNLDLALNEVKEEFKNSVHQLELKQVENKVLKSEISSLQSGMANLEITLKANHSTIGELNREKNNLISDIIELKGRCENNKMFKVDYFVAELQNILRILDCDDEFDMTDELVPIFSKIRERLTLLKEHRTMQEANSYHSNTTDLNDKIKSLESELQDAQSCKLTFAKELHLLKSDFGINDLLKRPLTDLLKLTLGEIMDRENLIIGKLKDEYDNKIGLLKDRIHQFEENDKRRAQWVSEVEYDNDQLNALSKLLKEDISTANEKLENKKICEELILKELFYLEKKLNSEPIESDLSSERCEKDVSKINDVSCDIYLKIQSINKGFISSDETGYAAVDKYKETIKTLENQCQTLKNKIDIVENSGRMCDEENTELKREMSEKVDSYEKEVSRLNEQLRNTELSLKVTSHKMQSMEEDLINEQEQLMREKAFSMKMLKDNDHLKSQINKHFESLTNVNDELSLAKESMKLKLSKKEEEIADLKETMANLKSESDKYHEIIKGKDALQSELFQANKIICELKENFSSKLLTLETQNKNLKNEINEKEKEISLLTERYNGEMVQLNGNLSDNNKFISTLERLNEDLKVKVSKLESELLEKEFLYQGSIANIIRDKDVDQIKLEKIVRDQEDKLEEIRGTNQLLQLEIEQKAAEFLDQLKTIECLNKELTNKLINIELTLKEKDNIHKREIFVLNEEKSNCIMKIDHLNNQLKDNSKDSNSFFRVDLLKLFPDFAECSSELISYIKSKLAENESLKEEFEDKKNECRYLEEDYDELDNKIKEKENRIGELCRKLYADEVKYEGQIEEQSSKMKDLENKLSSQTSEILKISEELKLQITLACDIKKINEDLEIKYNESIKEYDIVLHENTTLKNKLSHPKVCKECKILKEEVLGFKAKLKVKDVKIAELSSKSASASPLKERNCLLETYQAKLADLENENARLKSRDATDKPASCLSNYASGADSSTTQAQNISKLESRITKLEKDREFLKRLCEKRAAKVLALREELDSKNQKKT